MTDRVLSDTGDAATMSGIEALGDTALTCSIEKSFTDTTAVNWNVSNVTATYTVASAYRHNGARYGVQGYRLEQTSGSSLNTVTGTSYVMTFKYLQFGITGSASGGAAIANQCSGTVTYISCIGTETTSAGGCPPFYSASGTTNYYDCIGYSEKGNAAHGIFHRFSSGTVNCYRCLAYRRHGAAVAASFLGATASFTCYACIAGGSFATPTCYSASQSGNYNIAQDTSAVGANSVQSTAISGLVANVGVGTEDFHWTSYATAIATLTTPDYTGTAGTQDIDGTTRVSTGLTTAGPDQAIPAAPTVDATPAPAASYTVGDAYSVDHAFTGTGSGTWDISAGAVPSGTSIAGATGIVSGTLTTAQSVSYTARVTDAWGQTGTRAFTTTINTPAVISSGKQWLQLGLQLGLSIILCLALVLTGCASTVLYDEPGHVAIEYRGHDSQGVELFFTSPTKDSHLIQEVSWDWREGKGIESFRAPLPLWQRDRHSSRGADETRTMTIYPGTVEGQAETISGFAMLESDWPAGFNMGYRQWYPIKGRVVSAAREHGTTYSVTWRKDAISLAVAGKTFTWGR